MYLRINGFIDKNFGGPSALSTDWGLKYAFCVLFLSENEGGGGGQQRAAEGGGGRRRAARDGWRFEATLIADVYYSDRKLLAGLVRAERKA
jgi:hypothetical protein